jgi:hypothetical protein
MYTVFIVHTTPAKFRVVNAVAQGKLIPGMEIAVSAAYFNSDGSGCINPDHLTRRRVKKNCKQTQCKVQTR